MPPALLNATLRIALTTPGIPKKVNNRMPITPLFVLSADLHTVDDTTTFYELYGSLLHPMDGPHRHGHGYFPLPDEFECQREEWLFQSTTTDAARIQRHINELINALRA